MPLQVEVARSNGNLLHYSDIAGALVAEYGPAVLTTCTTATFDHRRWQNRSGGGGERPTSVECAALAEVGYLRRSDEGRRRKRRRKGP